MIDATHDAGLASWVDRAARPVAADIGEVALQRGVDGGPIDGEPVPPPERLTPLDTSGANDAFNTGYRQTRRAGRPSSDATPATGWPAGW